MRYLALLNDISYSTTRTLVTLMFLIQCSTKFSGAIIQLQGARKKASYTKMKSICQERWSFYLGLPPETLATFFYPLKLSSFYMVYFSVVKYVKLIQG